MRAERDKILTAYYLRRLDHPGPAEMVDFTFGEGDTDRRRQIRVARIELPTKDESLWFSGSVRRVPVVDHEHQFIGIYDSNDIALAELIAASAHYDEVVDRLGYGHTFPLGPRSTLRTLGFSAALVLDGSIYEPFENEARIANVPITFFAVVPITQKEVEVKKRDGLDQLLARWDEEGRDILSIPQQHSS